MTAPTRQRQGCLAPGAALTSTASMTTITKFTTGPGVDECPSCGAKVLVRAGAGLDLARIRHAAWCTRAESVRTFLVEVAQ